MSPPGSRHLWDVRVPMRDGVSLAADLYLPDGGEPAPALLMRTPYNKQTASYREFAERFVANGYAVVLQDVRGRHESDGGWYPFRDEGPDGYDTIEWIAEQAWSDGKVGLFGGSYGGWVQWAAARERPPHLAAMVSRAAGGRWMQEIPYDNGTVVLAMLGWLNLASGRTMKDAAAVDWRAVLHHLPLRTMDAALGRELPVWQDFLDHPTLDEYWAAIRLTAADFAAIDLPVLHITGWYDEDQPGALFFYEGMMRNSPAATRQAVCIGPWDHGGTGEPSRELGGVDFSPRAVVDVKDLHLQWFDRWLRGAEPRDGQTHATYFLTGINEWRGAAAWPPPEVRERRYYLSSHGRANTLRGDGSLASAPPESSSADEFTYDPEDPVVTVTDFDFYSDTGVEPTLDRRYVDRRDDVLVYTSEPMSEALTVAGRPSVLLFGSSDCPDTDWFVTLQDVHPRGPSVLLANGRLRARFRESLEREMLMEPGQIYEFRFELSTIGHVFAPGHRIRLTVTSSDFPVYDRNPNTGHPIGEDAELRVARNAIHHGEAEPSHVALPLPGGALP
jgi:putative CocE/NonD family hydrolase